MPQRLHVKHGAADVRVFHQLFQKALVAQQSSGM